MPPILDVAIGVVFVFLLFSLVVSALNEVILSYLDKRAAFLREGISELFRDSTPKEKQPPNTITVDRFFQHGMIAVLSRGRYGTSGNKTVTTGVPSYIPGKSFVLALLGLVTDGKNPTSISDLRATIEGIGNVELKQTLLALYDDARGNLDHFKANIENWFNESMDRVGGWYKRYAQQWLLALSLGLAIVCNVDSVRIIRALSLDKNLRESMVRQAEAYVKDSDAPAKATGAPGAASASSEPSEKIAKFKAALVELGGTGVPMGWSDGPSQTLVGSLPKLRNCFSFTFWKENLFTTKTSRAFALWFTAIMGWAITGLAASLGAPFWFDLLNRFIDIRGVGRAPEERDSTATRKPATGVESYVITGDSLRSIDTPLNLAEQTGITLQSPAPESGAPKRKRAKKPAKTE